MVIRCSWSIALACASVLVLAHASEAVAQSAGVQKLLDEADEAFGRGDYGHAAALYDGAIAAEPRSIDPTYYAKRADVFTLRRDFAGGLRWIDGTAATHRPGDVLILEKKAVLLGGAGRDREAVELAEQVIASVPRAYALHLLIGDRAFVDPAQAGRAIAAYQAFLTTRPATLAAADSTIRLKLAYAYLFRAASGAPSSARDFAAADRQLVTLAAGPLSAGPRRAVRNARCGALTGLRRHAEAVTACALAIAQSGGTADAALHYNHGVALLGLGRHPAAAAAAERYLELRPRAPRGWLLRGDVHLAAGEPDAAEASYQRARARGETPEVGLRRGRLALRRRPPDLELAIAELGRAQRAYPDDVELVAELAGAQVEAGRFDDAVALAEGGAARAGIAPKVRARLLVIAARALERGGRPPAQALTRYRDALAANASNRDAIAGAVGLLNLRATAEVAAGDVAAARATLDEAVALDAASAMTHYNRGALLLEARDPGAAAAVERALAAAPDEPRVRWLHGRVRLAAGATAEAATSLEQALTLAERGGDPAVAAAAGIDLAGVMIESGRLDEAFAALDRAAKAGGTSDALARNRALALLRRGLARLGAGRVNEASADLDKAAAATAQLSADEQRVLGFGQGAAAIAGGRIRDGRTRLERLAKELGDRPLPWLAAPWDRFGLDLFLAYSYYLEDGRTARRQAIKQLERLVGRSRGAVQQRARELLRSCHQLVAAGELDGGNPGGARRALEAARAAGAPGRDPRLDHNLIVLSAWTTPESARPALERLDGQPPESLVNLGVIAHREGRTLDAYELWKRARAAGVGSPAVVSWMQSIERVFGIAPGS